MVRTRGGSSQGDNRQQSTTLVRSDREQVHENVVNMKDATVEGHDVQDGYLWEPLDCSLLLSFADHVAIKLWKGEVKQKL